MTIFVGRPELLARFKHGERAALEEVYWAYVDRVELIARRGYFLAHKGLRVEGAPADEVADLVQEVFARAFAERARLAYDGLREYGPYLATISRNLLTDWARRSGRELPGGTLLELEPDTAGAAGAPDEPELPWTDPATLKVVETYLASLTPELRAVHEERYLRGRSQIAAAEALGISRQTLRTREAHLRDGLRKALARARRAG